MCEHCNRRAFLGTGVTGGMLLANASWAQMGYSQSLPTPRREKFRICVIITGTPVSEDRNWGVGGIQVEASKRRLSKLEKKLGNIELIVGQSSSAEQTSGILKKAGPKAPVRSVPLIMR